MSLSKTVSEFTKTRAELDGAVTEALKAQGETISALKELCLSLKDRIERIEAYIIDGIKK